MVINSPCLTDKKELASPWQTKTSKDFSNPLMDGSFPKTTNAKYVEDNVRSDLRLDDAEGTACLLNEEIFEGLARKGRIGAGFFGVITSVFDSMMVHAAADMGDTLRKEAETSHDESKDEDHVPTPSSDPLPSGENSSILNELVFYTSLQEQLLDLQEAKAAQAKEIVALKKKVSKLTKWRKSRSRGLRRLKKFGSGRTIDDEMFGVDDLAREEVVMDSAATTVKDSAALTTDDKGKAKMIKPEVPLKKKDQMRIDEEYARKIQAEKQAATRLSRAQQDEEANNSWDNIQAMMDADRLLVGRFKQEKGKNSLSTKRTTKNLKYDISKKQKVDENVEPVVDDSKELRKCIEIVPDDGDEVLIEATSISSRSLTIIDYKIHKEGKKTYFKIIRADGNSQVYQTFEKIFKSFNREDLELMCAIVKDRFKKEKPVDDMDNILFRTLNTMFE
nr:hypothetical protein [Tanacetum cinerariifolium]